MPQIAPPPARPVSSAPPARRRGAARLLVLLGALTAIGAISTDMYLPAFPAMTRDLHATPGQVQLSLATCLVGLALGQLITGPLSDRWGRRRPVIIGVGAYALLAVLCALAPSAGTLAALRLLQGFVGGTGMVVARAIVRDLYEGSAAARYFSRLTLVFGVAPIAAPSMGSLVLQFGSWRWIFAVLAVIGLLLAAAVAAWLPETLPAEHRHTGGLAATGRAVRVLITDRIYVGYAVAQGLALASLFAYISGSPFVFQDVFGLSASAFGLLFGLNAVGLVLAGQLNAKLLDRFPPRTLLVTTMTAGALIGVGVLAGAALGSLILVAVALFAFLASLGMVMPNGTALALDQHPRHAGTAAALMGAFQSVCAALVAPLVGFAGTGTALPMAAVLLVASLLCLATTLTLTRRASQSGV